MKDKLSNKIFLIVTLFVVVGVFISSQTSLAGGLVPVNSTGDYTVSQILAILPTAIQFMLGISGSIALLAFVYGGVLFLVSSGNRELVEKGKNVIKGAVVGLLLVFLSYTIIATIATTIWIITLIF